MTGEGSLPKCFIAMPVTTKENHAEQYGDPLHWRHVLDELFVPAVEAAGYEPIRPVAKGAFLIHDQIISSLESTDLVLCDLSGHNPNVFFELGVRTSLNLPIALVHDRTADLPFDTSGINTHTYSPLLNVWEIDQERAELTQHIRDSAASCDGENPLWRRFGLTKRASEPQVSETREEAKVDIVLQEVRGLADAVDGLKRRGTADLGVRPRAVPSGPTNEKVAEFVGFARAKLDSHRYSLKPHRGEDGPVEILVSDYISKAAVQELHEQAKRSGIRLVITSAP